MLSPMIEALSRDLSLIPGIDRVETVYPRSLPDQRNLILYASPGQALPMQQTGRNGKPVYLATDSIMIEYHRKVALDEAGEAEAETRDMLDAVRLAIWQGIVDHRLGGQVAGIVSMGTEHYGTFEVGTDTSFGFRLNVAVEHATEY